MQVFMQKKCKFSSFYLKISDFFCTFAVAKVLIQNYETVTNCYQLKLTAADGKKRLTDITKFIMGEFVV